LGFLLSDIPSAEVFQLHREPPDWKWQTLSESCAFVIEEPALTSGADPALILSLSATIDPSRLRAVLGQEIPLWTVSIPEPHNDFLKSREQLRYFRSVIRRLMDRIKAVHGENATIRLFCTQLGCHLH